MKRLVILIGSVVSVIAIAAVRQGRRAQAEAELWAEATDPISPTERRLQP